MKLISATLLLTSFLTFNSAMAESIVCVSSPNANGGTVSIEIAQDQTGNSTITLFAQGGFAHFMSKVGPFEATVLHEADGSFYSFEDNSGQKATVAIMTNGIGGKLETIASTNFGLWKNASMICR